MALQNLIQKVGIRSALIWQTFETYSFEFFCKWMEKVSIKAVHNANDEESSSYNSKGIFSF